MCLRQFVYVYTVYCCVAATIKRCTQRVVYKQKKFSIIVFAEKTLKKKLNVVMSSVFFYLLINIQNGLTSGFTS